MAENPFSSFNIELPKKYDDQIKQYCVTGGGQKSREQAPFERQVDFWYCAFLLAVKKRLSPVKEKEVYNATAASILSTDAYRISHIQAVFLAMSEDLELLANDRKVLDFALEMANAGIPLLLQILGDVEQKPLWNLLDELEASH